MELGGRFFILSIFDFSGLVLFNCLWVYMNIKFKMMKMKRKKREEEGRRRRKGKNCVLVVQCGI